MTAPTQAGGEILLSADEVAHRVERLAQEIAPAVDDDWIIVCLLLGGLWFAADLTRALARLGRAPLFDALWLASYGDARQSSGAVTVHAPLQRAVRGARVLILDEVIESGLSLAAARRIVQDGGAGAVRTCVFARKPWPSAREIEPDYVGWEAPARFLAGYGMDLAGRRRGWPDLVALD